MTRATVRQGDVLIVPIDALPENLTAVAPVRGRVVLAEGEATGHAHTIEAERADFFTADVLQEAERILMVHAGGAVVEHQEHSAITLEPGPYRVIRQVEWTDADEPVLQRD